MAVYHKNLKYHEDNIEKHKITKEELQFLKDLQKELNTQDDVGQADPKFWVIKGTEKLYDVEDADGFELYDMDDGSIVALSMKEVVDYINNNLLENIYNSEGIIYKISLAEGTFNENILVEWTDNGEKESEDLDTKEDVLRWLHEHGCYGYDAASYKIFPRIYADTMFLTQIDAENHLKSNYYHYSEDAHTYAMTAWRSPRVEKLIDILQKVEWQN